MLNFGRGAFQRLVKRIGISRAVAFDHHALQTKQRSTIIAAMVDAFAKTVDHRIGGNCRHFAKNILGVFLLQEVTHHLGDSLGGFEHDVADEAVADDDVGGAVVDIGTFDVAVKIEMAGAQKLARASDILIALELFGANIEQAHTGVFLALDGRGQHCTHDGELKQMLGSALRIGA